jgi:putative cardiolipin synthase
VVLVGPVVKEVSDEFDLYWNNQSSIPITTLAKKTTPEQFAAKRAALTRLPRNGEELPPTRRACATVIWPAAQESRYFLHWGKATIVNDHPDKVATSSEKTETHLAPQLRAVADKTKRELFLVSPYFVPGKKGVELLAGVHQRGARVVVITNSLASTDGVPVHSKYKRTARR